ncbi:MAG: response regulator [Mariprofundaceae bacterium]|nr:response regulator [Mariprofundaceae bacterium]
MQTDAPSILMVEDDEMLLEFYEAALVPEYEVLTATDLASALHVLQGQHVDAVACDLHLGGVSGLELLRWISENLPGLLARTAVISGESEPKLGGFDVLVAGKPIMAEGLHQVFGQLLTRNDAGKSVHGSAA